MNKKKTVYIRKCPLTNSRETFIAKILRVAFYSSKLHLEEISGLT